MELNKKDAAKKLGFDEFLRNHRAINLHEGTPRPYAPLVNLPGDEFFARSRFAANENPCAGRFGLSNVLSMTVLGDSYLRLPPPGIRRHEKNTHSTISHVMSNVCQTHNLSMLVRGNLSGFLE